jgi:hypothetical protein
LDISDDEFVFFPDIIVHVVRRPQPTATAGIFKRGNDNHPKAAKRESRDSYIGLGCKAGWYDSEGIDMG